MTDEWDKDSQSSSSPPIFLPRDDTVRYTTPSCSSGHQEHDFDRFVNRSISASFHAQKDDMVSFSFAKSVSSNKKGQSGYTLDEAFNHIGFGVYQVKLILVTGLSWMADAMEMMVLSIISPVLMCEWGLSSFQEAFITTSVFLGLGFGSAFWGWICDYYGRKKGLYVSVICVLVFGVLSSQSPNYGWIVFFRFCVGFSVGGAPQAVTIATEMLPSRSRGRSVIVLAAFWALGAVFAAALAVGVVQQLNWRWYLLMICIPILVFLIAGYWLPESPRFLLTLGKYDDVMKCLREVARQNKASLPAGDLRKVDINVSRGKITELFSKERRLLTCMLWLIWFTSAFAYYGIVLLTTEIFQTGLGGCHPSKGAVAALGNCRKLTRHDYNDFMWTTIAEFPGVLGAILLIENLGRKKTFAILFAGGAAAFMLLAFCTARSVTLVFIFAARACVTGGFQVAFVYTPEVMPTNIRSVGLGACSMFARLGAMLTPFAAQVLIHWSFFAVVGVYAFLLVLCTGVSMLLPVETKGIVLQDSTIIRQSSHSPTALQRGYQRFT